jgi:YafQ family addiction module toxin component
MPYSIEYDPECKKEIQKLCRKNTTLETTLKKKMEQILEMPHHFKPLSNPMQHRRRVHILKSFVLTYTIFEDNKTVKFLSFTHHDKAY